MKNNLLISSHLALRGISRFFTFKTFYKQSFLAAAILSCTMATAQKWRVIGNEEQLATGSSTYTNITSVTIGGVSTHYVVFVESGIAKVKKYAAGSWQSVGGNVAAGSPTYTRIIADRNGKLYVSYVDAANSSRLAVKTYNTATDVWEPINGLSSNLYVSSSTVTYSSPSQYSTSPRHQMDFDTAARPMIVYGEGSSLTPTVKRFNGTVWELVGGTTVSADIAASVGMAVDSTSNIPYVVYVKQATTGSTTGNLAVSKYNGISWVAITIPAQAGGVTQGGTTGIRHTAITFNRAWNPVITYFATANSNKNTAVIYNKTADTWAFSGSLSTRDAPNTALARDREGNVYASCADMIASNSGRTVAKVFKLPGGSTDAWTELKNPSITGIDEPAGSISIAAVNDTTRPIIVYTKANFNSTVTPTVQVWSDDSTVAIIIPADTIVTTPKQMEVLTRGLVAVRLNATQVYLGWRLFGTDATATAFNVYRNGTKINASPITTTTNYIDSSASGIPSYTIRPVLNGIEASETAPVTPWSNIYKSIGIQRPAGGVTPDTVSYTYSANDCSVGDVDGDGEYEIFLKWDPSNSKDNSQDGYTGNVFIDCYKLNGTRLWRVDLGRNIRAGAHYTQFMVYDFDGDGKAEMMCKTADATVDGVGTVIGNATADYRNSSGYVLSGAEYLTVFNGMTGAAMASSNYVPARGTVSGWGDSYGNRVDRFIAAVAYLDGQRPSAVFGRGYYTRLVRAAWDWRGGKLTLRWVFDSNTAGNGAYAGQGNHQMTVGDVDGDGKDEFCNGASAINDNGSGKYANGLGHGDALHMTDLDPGRPGQEVWQCHEEPGSYGNYGLEFRDAKTGQPLWGVPGNNTDVGRCMTGDIDPRYKGCEAWGSVGALYNCKGDSIAKNHPSYNFGIWWDGDLLRELLDGTVLDKWNYNTGSSNRLLTIYNYGSASSNNTTKNNPCLTADLLGDWREEILMRNSNSDSLLLFTTTAKTNYRLYTLMHNPQYRVAVAWQNSAYNQPPWPDYYLGDSMVTPPMPNIYTTSAVLPVKLVSFTAVENNGKTDLAWKTATETNSSYFTIERSADGKEFTAIGQVKAAGSSNSERSYQSTDAQPFIGANYYRLKQTDADGRSEYSSVVRVDIGAKRETLSISPNPVTNQVKLLLNSNSGHLVLRVIATNGKMVMHQTGSVNVLNSALNKALSSFGSGIYLLEVTDGYKVYNAKMVKE